MKTRIGLRRIGDPSLSLRILVPILSVVASFAKGETVFYNVSRLRSKESDRIESTLTMLRSFNVECHADENSLTVKGSTPKGYEIDSFGDHRIAMAGSVLALSSHSDCLIKNAECVSKSYPDFFSDLEKLIIKE